MATYRGKKVALNKVTKGDVKKFKVFVKKGNRVAYFLEVVLQASKRLLF